MYLLTGTNNLTHLHMSNSTYTPAEFIIEFKTLTDRKAKKELLSDISSTFQALKILNGKNVNTQLKEWYGITGEAKTFAQWKKEGKKVKKGEAGYPIWSMPKGITVEKETKEGNKEEKQIQFFGLAYLFTAEQVEGI